MTAVAYLRRSRVDTRRPGTLSHEQQMQRIRELATRHGDEDLVVIEDWGKSGREEKLHLRAGFARLEAMVEASEVSAVYAFDLSRLGRSVITMHRLAKRCGELKIPIRCAQGLSPDVSSSEGRMVLTILLAIGEFYAENVKERAAAVTAMRRQRGDRIGKAPYGQRVRGGKLEDNPDEDLAAVVDAFRRAGGVTPACRLLNAEGVPTRAGGPWQVSTLAQVLETAGVLERRATRGRPRTIRTFLLNGLLRCACGATLTGVLSNGGRNVGYECKRARVDSEHGRRWISEAKLRPWVQTEAARFRRPGDVVELADEDPDALRGELEAKRRRILDNYEDGLIDRSARNAKLADVDAELARVGAAPRVEGIPEAIDWAWSTETLNAVLRALWDHVELDAELAPVAAAWAVPEWQKAD